MLPAASCVLSAGCDCAAKLRFWPVLTARAELAGNTANTYGSTVMLGCDVGWYNPLQSAGKKMKAQQGFGSMFHVTAWRAAMMQVSSSTRSTPPLLCKRVTTTHALSHCNVPCFVLFCEWGQHKLSSSACPRGAVGCGAAVQLHAQGLCTAVRMGEGARVAHACAAGRPRRHGHQRQQPDY